MKILAFSDWRVQRIDSLVEYVKNLDYTPDLIIYAGDDVDRFNSATLGIATCNVGNSEINYFEKLAELSEYGLCAVIGNDDPEIMRILIRGKNVFEVENAPKIFGDVAICGLGGASTSPAMYKYSEEEARGILNKNKKKFGSKKIILVSHAPPYGILDMGIRFGMNHIGSIAVREFMERNKNVVLVVCGHSHSQGGKEKNHGQCMVVNCASHDSEGDPGRIAHITLQKSGGIDVEWDFLRDGSELKQVPLVGYRNAELLNEIGIKTIEQLADINQEAKEVRSLPRWLRPMIPLIKNYARAIVTGKSVITRVHPFFYKTDKTKLFFFDTEYDPVPKEFGIFLIGVMDRKGKVKQYFLEEPKDEKKMLETFNDWLEKTRPTLVTYSSTSADRPQLIKAFRRFGMSTKLLERSFFDLYYDCINTQKSKEQTIFLPMKGSVGFMGMTKMGVKSVSDYFGFKKPKNMEIEDGLAALSAYASFLEDKSTKTRKELLKYNKSDLKRCAMVYDSLDEIFRSKKEN
jgi:Icc-related predicted phosphoesterase/uncharacterized protein YprB with RNaseH-like and TPR domain